MRRPVAAPSRHQRAQFSFSLDNALSFGALAVAGMLVSACASGYDAPSHVGAGRAEVAVVVPPAKVEFEADGLAVQAPPRLRHRLEPDDPSEPFSPNYGPAPLPDDKTGKSSRQPTQAFAAPPQIRSRVTPMSHAEAEAIIARAMVAHERLYP